MQSSTDNFIKNEFYRRGFTYRVYNHKIGESYIDYSHNQTELLCLISGKIKVEIENKEINVIEKKFYIIERGLNHSLWVLQNSYVAYGYQ